MSTSKGTLVYYHFLSCSVVTWHSRAIPEWYATRLLRLNLPFTEWTTHHSMTHHARLVNDQSIPAWRPFRYTTHRPYAYANLGLYIWFRQITHRGKSSESVQLAICWRPATHAQTWASDSAHVPIRKTFSSRRCMSDSSACHTVTQIKILRVAVRESLVRERACSWRHRQVRSNYGWPVSTAWVKQRWDICRSVVLADCFVYIRLTSLVGIYSSFWQTPHWVVRFLQL